MYRITLFFLLFISSSPLMLSQTKNYYLVYFSDKTNTPFSLDDPTTFLTQKSIDRRGKQGYPLTSLDLPVDPVYTDSLRLRTVEVKNTSRWFNAALIFADTTLVKDSVESLSFVDSVAILSNYGGGLNLKSASKARTKFSTESTANTATNSSDLTQLNMLNAYYMDTLGYQGDSMTIAVIDAGFHNVDIREGFAHLFTNNQILGTYDFVDHETAVYEDHSHGTEVLSVIAGKNGEDNLGVAPNASFYLFRTEDDGSEYPIEEINWLLAVEKADSLGVDIVSTSLGYFDFDDAFFNYTYDDLDGQTAYSSQAARIAARTGMLLVNSAGNEGRSSWRYVTVPADVDSVLTVGAVYYNETYASFSSVGPTSDGRTKPNVAAQGVSTVILSSVRDGVTTNRGTSFSCPLIAGFAAGVWQAYDTLTNIELLKLLEQAGSRADDPNNEIGYGIPTFSRVQSIMEGTIIVDVLDIVAVNPVTDQNIMLHIPLNQIGKEITMVLFDVNGHELYRQKHSLSSSTYDTNYSLKDLDNGTYFLQVIEEDSSVLMRLLNMK